MSTAYAMGPRGGRVWWDKQKQTWIVRGNERHTLLGRSSFKIANLLSMHFKGKGDDYPGGALEVVKKWISHSQAVFGREDVVLRVFGETGAWRQVPAGAGMFGSPAQDQGIHDVASYRLLCERNDRVRQLTTMNHRVIEELFKLSHETGCVWEYIIDATLKHTDGLCTGVIDHVIRQTAVFMYDMAAVYPKAAFIVSSRNEANAHNKTQTTVSQVNKWAERWYRWKHPDGRTQLAFDSPGDEFEPEQWPGCLLIVDDGGGDIFQYECGPEAGKYKAAMIHPGRKGHDKGEPWNPRDWKKFPNAMIERLIADGRGQPWGAPESMYLVTKAGTEGWYRAPSGWNKNQNDQLEFFEEMIAKLRYVIDHVDFGAQTDVDWRDSNGERWDRQLAELLSGSIPEPGPPEPDLWAEGHLPWVRHAYMQYLKRDPKAGDDQAAFAYAEQLSLHEEKLRARDHLSTLYAEAGQTGDFSEYLQMFAMYDALPDGLSQTEIEHALASSEEAVSKL